jgi:hypothetical protein
MKQILLALAILTAFPAMAQTAVTAPSAPVIPNMATVSPNATAALAIATTNRIFIDQSGDNPNVNMTQDGTGNAAGSGGRPIYLRGIDQKIVTRQIGVSNDISLEAVNDTTGTGKGVNITIQQIGDSNRVDAACGYGTASTGGTALTGCNAADLNWKFTGDSNDLQYRGGGSDLISHIDATGNSNVFRIDQLGDKHSQLINLTGDSNTFNITQSGGVTNGNHIVVSMTTSNSNTVNISQTGAVDNYLNLKTAGTTSGTFNIVQKP